MNVDGWAFTKNEDEGRAANRKIEYMFAIDGKNDFVEVESVYNGHAHKTYKGFLKEGHPDITLKELLVWLDDGNLCFGGRGLIYPNGKFEATVHTD